MSLNPQQTSLHLALPSSSAQSRIPTNISVHPSVIASILTHHSRRTDTEQPRVLGALLGHRSESGSEVEVRSCFAVPHTESEETVALDMPFQKNMVAMMAKTGIKEQVVGW
jgi:translation initiation factor 3 subunit F